MQEHGVRIKPFDQSYNEYRFAVYNRIREAQIDRIITIISDYFASASAWFICKVRNLGWFDSDMQINGDLYVVENVVAGH